MSWDFTNEQGFAHPYKHENYPCRTNDNVPISFCFSLFYPSNIGLFAFDSSPVECKQTDIFMISHERNIE